MNNTITYANAEMFYDGIYELTKRGMTFKADADLLTITLTGGY